MRRTVVELAREIRDDGVLDVAAGVTFWLLLSLPAAFLTVLSSVSLLGDDLTQELEANVLEFVDSVLTTEASGLRDSIEALFNQSNPGVLSASIAVAVFTLSRGFAGLIRALDLVYDVDDGRNFIHTRAIAIGLAIGTLLTVAVSTALWSLGAEAGVPNPLRLIVALAVLIVWSATIFHVGPYHHTPWRYDLPGAVFAAAGWLVLSLGFGWYVQLVGTGGGNDVLGAIGGVLLGLTWMWAACVVLLIGGELNQIIAERHGVISETESVVVGRLTEYARRPIERFRRSAPPEPPER